MIFYTHFYRLISLTVSTQFIGDFPIVREKNNMYYLVGYLSFIGIGQLL